MLPCLCLSFTEGSSEMITVPRQDKHYTVLHLGSLGVWISDQWLIFALYNGPKYAGVLPSFHLRMETVSVSETLCSVYNIRQQTKSKIYMHNLN
jgi:hypothetical protein